ncbi:PadR family transcriptional regulator [Anaerovorax sp. IOR16]|uniref:PadR family transcriptional regulator n=1 Tax=Anaerovorax sp. IOR16 TaxID=2773458 RepID=UPI0019D13F59|nr:PadR family transcriptional regulator [Anaerovorax sp. IOR16]
MAFQVGSAFLDACVLAVLSNEDMYGYVLTQKMREATDISESTLYPVLRRLQKSGYLTTYDQPFQGRNRRYYAITEEGKLKVEAYRRDWTDYKNRVDQVMFGGLQDE